MNLKNYKIKDQLCTKLKNRLPGMEAWKEFIPTGKIINKKSNHSLSKASVLILLHQKNNRWSFPLIRRTEDNLPHSGQMALPGGRVESSEAPNQTAIREAHEEIGVKIDDIEIIGQLTPLPVDVSGYLVYPFVAIYKSRPIWTPQIDEVAQIYDIYLDQLLDSKTKKISTESKLYPKIPYYELDDQMVWGATAMILSELEQILISN